MGGGSSTALQESTWHRPLDSLLFYWASCQRRNLRRKHVETLRKSSRHTGAWSVWFHGVWSRLCFLEGHDVMTPPYVFGVWKPSFFFRDFRDRKLEGMKKEGETPWWGMMRDDGRMMKDDGFKVGRVTSHIPKNPDPSRSNRMFWAPIPSLE